MDGDAPAGGTYGYGNGIYDSVCLGNIVTYCEETTCLFVNVYNSVIQTNRGTEILFSTAGIGLGFINCHGCQAETNTLFNVQSASPIGLFINGSERIIAIENDIKGGTTNNIGDAIYLLGNSDNNIIKDNTISDADFGINILTGCNGNKIGPNTYVNVTTELADVAANGNHYGNVTRHGTADPSGAVQGIIGDRYIDTATGRRYTCTSFPYGTTWTEEPINQILQLIDSVGGLVLTNVAQVIPFNVESIKDSYYTHSTTVNPGEVTINQDGLYKISSLMTIGSIDDTGGIRGNPRMNIQIDTGSGFVAQLDTMGGYVRENDTEELSCSVTGIGYFQFSAGDKLRITTYDTVATEPNEDTQPYSQRLLIEYIHR
jgi:hypothetical protein